MPTFVTWIPPKILQIKLLVLCSVKYQTHKVVHLSVSAFTGAMGLYDAAFKLTITDENVVDRGVVVLT